MGAPLPFLGLGPPGEKAVLGLEVLGEDFGEVVRREIVAVVDQRVVRHVSSPPDRMRGRVSDDRGRCPARVCPGRRARAAGEAGGLQLVQEVGLVDRRLLDLSLTASALAGQGVQGLRTPVHEALAVVGERDADLLRPVLLGPLQVLAGPRHRCRHQRLEVAEVARITGAGEVGADLRRVQGRRHLRHGGVRVGVTAIQRTTVGRPSALE
ncbi:hypothetical protein NKH18_38375 [Streptomyces sp. M10(2022)]